MPATLLHLVRHGEVHNPDRVLYGRIPGFHLSELGHRMAGLAADALEGHDVRALYASPLQRTQESAAPWATAFDLAVQTEDRIIEPYNKFEGRSSVFGASSFLRPEVWPWLWNPMRPSWGEPFVEVAARMMSAMREAWLSADGGEVVMVSHQMPIWMVARTVAGKPLYHDPRKRRCSLSSITTVEWREAVPGAGRFVEVNYQDPAKELLAASIDLGAV